MTSSLQAKSITLPELERLEDAFVKEVGESPNKQASPQTLFNYSFGLIHSPVRSDIEKGIKLLEELLLVSPAFRRECYFFLATAHCELGHYLQAREYNDRLLAAEPNNAQALQLRAKINELVTRDGAVGMAIIGGVVAVAGVLTTILLSRRH